MKRERAVDITIERNDDSQTHNYYIIIEQKVQKYHNIMLTHILYTVTVMCSYHDFVSDTQCLP